MVTGPRRAGKTTALRQAFPRAHYVLLEDPDVKERARSDPRGLLDELRTPVLFDGVHNVPELLAYVRVRIDERPREKGRWIFTGCQEDPLLQAVRESLPGRAAILQMMPFSLAETPRASVLLGGYPEVLARPASCSLWFSSYMQTYLERDVRAVTNVKDLGTFRRFIAMVASRHGQLLNRTDLAGPLGVSVPTVSDWLHVLEVTGQIILVPPYFENFGKRLIKSPKVYIGDSGFACYLLGITSQTELDRSPFLGALFEGHVAAEIIKSQINRGDRKELYHFRDQQGLEVDFLFPARGGDLWMVECKAAKTIQSHMTGPLRTLREAMGTMGQKVNIKTMIVHRAAKTAAPRQGSLAGRYGAGYWRVCGYDRGCKEKTNC